MSRQKRHTMGMYGPCDWTWQGQGFKKFKNVGELLKFHIELDAESPDFTYKPPKTQAEWHKCLKTVLFLENKVNELEELIEAVFNHLEGAWVESDTLAKNIDTAYQNMRNKFNRACP